MALLNVLLLLGLGVSVNLGVALQKRIIGGHSCAPTERLYHVRLMMRNATHMTICGGSLIHPQWILTADSCWKSEQGWINEALLNAHPTIDRRRINRIRHPPKHYAPEGWNHDIMLVKLPRRITRYLIAPLPDCSYRLKIGDIVQLAGEGAITTGPNYQRLPNTGIVSRLQCVEMRVIQVSHFLPTYGHKFYAVAPNSDVCHGDAGGAVLFNGRIYGVISPGVSHHACQRPVSIVDVCEYIQWIRTTIGFI